MQTPKEILKGFEAQFKILRSIEHASQLKTFIRTSPFKTEADAYAHLLEGLFVSKTTAEIAAFFNLPEFIASDMQAAALASAAERAVATEPGKKMAVDLLTEILGSGKIKLPEAGNKTPEAVQASAAKFSDQIKAAFKAAGIDAEIETQVINLGKEGGGLDGIVKAAVEEVLGSGTGCSDPECGACRLGEAVEDAMKTGKISAEEMMLMASEAPAKRAARTEKMAHEVHAGRPAIDVLIENARELRAANSH